jgi:hypothetical protein
MSLLWDVSHEKALLRIQISEYFQKVLLVDIFMTWLLKADLKTVKCKD